MEVIVRNSDGAFVFGVARHLLASSCLMVEALASREAIILAHALSLNMLPESVNLEILPDILTFSSEFHNQF